MNTNILSSNTPVGVIGAGTMGHGIAQVAAICTGEFAENPYPPGRKKTHDRGG